MSRPDDSFRAYSAEILSFSLAGRRPADPSPSPDPALTRRRAATLERMLTESGKSGLVLLGVGSGALVAELVGRLGRIGGADDLLVCDLSPERVREAVASGRLDLASVRLFVDSSPWAHLVFLASRGFSNETRLFAVNPEGTAVERKEHADLQKAWLSAAPRRVEAVPSVAPVNPARPDGAYAAPSMAVAAILHPEEPGLEEFFAALPSLAAEIVLVWDQPENDPLPRRETIRRLPPAARLTELRRPLAADFAAQRNAMLDACSADWVLYLDGDERLAPGDWERASALAASGLAEAWLFPRLTFWPGPDHAQAGYGLWPDPQLRLFSRASGPRFERPVHERLTGLRGPFGLALDLPIRHESYLRKDQKRIEAKLRVFDHAGGGAVRHRRGAGYPSLPASLLQPPGDPRFVSCLLLRSIPS